MGNSLWASGFSLCLAATRSIDMALATDDLLIARNPATGAELGRVPVTPPGRVAAVVRLAREAQARWARADWRTRQAVLARWWGLLSRGTDRLAEAIRAEVGKPGAEATSELVLTLDAVRWTVRQGQRALAVER